MIKCYQKGYFRPQFVRKHWIDMNGVWNFVFDDENIGEKVGFFKQFPTNSLKINVPYSYETPASGIGDESVHNVVWYQKIFKAEEIETKKRYIINFEGADYVTKVWVNGIFIGSHIGGNCRFSFDITNAILSNKENNMIVKCEDSLDTTQPRGKQRWLKDSFGCWYIQTTGIWKPVWSEIVSETRLDYVKITPDIDTESVRFDYTVTDIRKNVEIETKISFEDVFVTSSRYSVKNKNSWQSLDIRCSAFDFKVKCWNPDFPNLYDVEFIVYEDGKEVDRVGSYFGMRKIQADEKGIRLNNCPLYQKLVLAQNYWTKTGYTMPDEDAAKKDIAIAKAAGFNGLRIHQKIEDERFLLHCDVDGIFVWAEFPAAYEFNYTAVKNLTDEWMDAVKQQYNHPSIITWVPFNESWGLPNIFTQKTQQEFTCGIYSLTKSFDSMRPVITNDGWEHTCSDIITLHDYDGAGEHMLPRYKNGLKDILENRVAHGQYKFAFAQGYAYKGQPIIVSEYGGIAMEGGEGWGYNGRVKDGESLIKKYDDLTSAIKSMENVCGYCYTQLTDLYQEINGLVDMDRNPKVDLAIIKSINDK